MDGHYVHVQCNFFRTIRTCTCTCMYYSILIVSVTSRARDCSIREVLSKKFCLENMLTSKGISGQISLSLLSCFFQRSKGLNPRTPQNPLPSLCHNQIQREGKESTGMSNFSLLCMSHFLCAPHTNFGSVPFLSMWCSPHPSQPPNPPTGPLLNSMHYANWLEHEHCGIYEDVWMAIDCCALSCPTAAMPLDPCLNWLLGNSQQYYLVISCGS